MRTSVLPCRGVRCVCSERSILPSSRPSGSCLSPVIIGAGPGSVPGSTPTLHRSAGLCLKTRNWINNHGHPQQVTGRIDMPAAAHPIPIRVPGNHPSAWRPSECGRAPRRAAVTRTGHCHSDGPLSLGSPATSDTPRNSSPCRGVRASHAHWRARSHKSGGREGNVAQVGSNRLWLEGVEVLLTRQLGSGDEARHPGGPPR